AVSSLPDIDTALLVLMGLGHVGYGSKKVLDRVGAKAPVAVHAPSAAEQKAPARRTAAAPKEKPPETSPVITPP
ncbi:MAG: hypothetical protein ACXVRK_12310, partial [Gaiellaceae bacterium]